MSPSYAFTATTDKRRPSALVSPCHIGPTGVDPSTFRTFQAIWDTGATHSAITQEVVDQCELKPIRKAKVAHAGMNNEPDETNVFLVDVGLPNRVLMQRVEVSQGGFKGGDVLIGMDIINEGDFAITHPGGITQFTFQYPSQADIDFTLAQPAPPPRNRAQRRALKRRKQ